MRLMQGCAAALMAGAGTVAGCGSEDLSAEKLASAVKPSVVKLSGRLGDGRVGGSGVVIDAAKGHVLTNAHVVAGVSALKARVGDDSATVGSARVVAQAPCDDIAIVQLVNPPLDLRSLELGESAQVKSGEHVTAFGYPTTFRNAQPRTVVVTSGTVSSPRVSAAPDRSLPKLPSTIQHQAPVNPGNSGGPLVNDAGRLIAINTLTNSRQQGQTIQGQHYAIAIDHVKKLLARLQAGKSIAYAGWDLSPVRDLPIRRIFAADPDFTIPNSGADRRAAASVARLIRADPSMQGLYVFATDTDSPARKAGLVRGDVITSIEDTQVKSVSDVCDIIASRGVGNKLRMTGYYLNSARDYGQILKPWTAQLKLK